MHKNYIEHIPIYPTVLYDLTARFINAIAPRLHILIARGKALPLNTIEGIYKSGPTLQ